MRFLFLENDVDFTQDIERQITASGVAESFRLPYQRYADALKVLQQQSFDAVFLDWPEGYDDRFAICRQLRAATKKPLLAFTTSDDVDEAIRIVEAGADDVLPRGYVTADAIPLRLHLAQERLSHSCIASPSHATGQRQAEGQPRLRTASVTWAGLQKHPLRLLHVARKASLHERMQPVLDRLSTMVANTDRWSCFDTLPELLCRESFDVVLIDVDEQDITGLYAIESVRARDHQMAVIAITGELERRFAAMAIQNGADDCLAQRQLDPQRLSRSMRLAIARRQRQAAGAQATSEIRYAHRAESAIVGPAAERRQDTRFFVTRSAVVIPVLPDSAPDRSLLAEGFTTDVSNCGLGLEVSGLDRLPSKLLVVGVEADDGNLHYATVEARNWTELSGRLRIGGRFVEAHRDVLREDNLIPSLRPQSMTFGTGIPAESLLKWVEIGVLRPVLWDRHCVCPKCRSLPTVRYGCRSCGSVRLDSQQLIHHFACAYVAHIDQFYVDGEVTCPKCRMRGLVVGADFEHLHGPFHCLDCGWSDTETELIGDCLRCHWRFPFQQSAEEELIGYHVNRLDPLAVIGAE